MTEASNNYRLFKVAKELNTGSSTLVEHLNAKGFNVNNSPNEKLSEDMYNALVREFASEKVLKQKADQIKEAKQERRTQREESEHEDDEEILSARDLKSGILDAKGSTPKLELRPRVQQHQQPQQQPQHQPQAREEKPPVQEEKPEIPAQKGAEAETHGLKVVGKVDLSQFDRKKTTKPENKPQDRRQDKPQQREQQQQPRVEAPKPEARVEKPVERLVEQPKVETPKVQETPKVVEQPVVEQPQIQVDIPVEQEVMRAADNAEKLRGLNVLGKIDLPDVRRGSKLKGKEAAPVAGSTPATGVESEEDKKKRRRKRKRSKTGVPPAGSTPTTPGTQGPNRGPGNGPARPGNRGAGGPVKKKEEPNQRELNDQVRSILADMNKGASRARQGMRSDKRARHRERREQEYLREQEEAAILEVTEFISANELAGLMDLPVTELITKCMEVGQFISINQRLDSDIINLLAEEYGFEVRFVDIADKAFEEEGEVIDAAEDLVYRAPIVTVMGHVDHGKTSLLDYVRKANVIAGEAGGITQHIGAYEVSLEDGRKICFLDTPGHEAFTAMRARGAKVTDIAIIVVAADDSVMPQTKEAINHAEAAGVPMVFAINKVDKPAADPDRIRRQLSEINIVLEEWGGKFQSQEISAKTGQGMAELLEKVLLEAEILDLKANPNKPAKGTVIEARLDKGRGTVATVLVQDGTLKIGDAMVGGVYSGRVRALMDERGKRIKSAGPSTPVQLLGLTGTPQAGDRFIVYEDERKAKEVASRRSELFREQSLRHQKRLTLEEVARRNARGEFKELKIIVKGDVDGSVEALSDSLLKLSVDEVAVTVIRKAVGQISEADVLLASASEAIIIGFQVRPSVSARKLAETEGIDIRHYSVIYDAINDVKDALEGLLSPEVKEEITGTAEIRSVFKITKVGAVAGCMVTDGSFNRKDPIRLIREGIVIFSGHLSSLKRFKDDAREVLKGFECGMQINNYNDIHEGDFIEQYRTTEVMRKLK